MPFKDKKEGTTHYLDENGKLVGEVPVYDVIEHRVEQTGLYKGLEVRYVIDAPLEVFLNKSVGLRIDGRAPMFLKFDTATKTRIDGHIYTALIKERFELVEDDDDSRESLTFSQESELCNIIGFWYLKWKNNLVDYETRTHRLGFAVQNLKDMICKTEFDFNKNNNEE